MCLQDEVFHAGCQHWGQRPHVYWTCPDMQSRRGWAQSCWNRQTVSSIRRASLCERCEAGPPSHQHQGSLPQLPLTTLLLQDVGARILPYLYLALFRHAVVVSHTTEQLQDLFNLTAFASSKSCVWQKRLTPYSLSRCLC